MPKLRVYDSATELLYILDVTEEDAQKANEDANYAMQLLNTYKGNDDPKAETSVGTEEEMQDLSDLSQEKGDSFTDGFRWPHEAILLLLKYYKEQKSHMSTGKMTQKKFWALVASELTKKGYEVTGSQCKSKISGLRNTYKNIKAHRNERYRRTWHYYEILDKLYQNKETTWAENSETVDDDQAPSSENNSAVTRKSNKRASSLLESEPTPKRLKSSDDIINIMEVRAKERRKMHEEAMARQDSLLDVLKKTISVTEKSLLQRRVIHEEAMARQDKLLNVLETILEKFLQKSN